VTADPSLRLAAGVLKNQENIAYRIEGGEASVVCEDIREFATAPVPISHEPVTAGASQICKGTPRWDLTRQWWLH